MEPIFLAVLIVVLLFGFVVLFGAPYLPVLSTQKKAALELLNLKAGETMLELGCGDGRVLKAAAQKGINAVGYELNPVLVLTAWLQTWRHRSLVTVKWGNYWHMKWPEAQGIYTFLLPQYMKKLDKKITQEYNNSVKLVSIAFEVPGKKQTKEYNGVYLYEYPDNK